MRVDKSLGYNIAPVPAEQPLINLVEKRHVRHGWSFEHSLDRSKSLGERLPFVRMTESAKKIVGKFSGTDSGRFVVEPWILNFGDEPLNEMKKYCQRHGYALATPSDGADIIPGSDPAVFRDVGTVLLPGETILDYDRATHILCIRECASAVPLLDEETLDPSKNRKKLWWMLAYKKIRKLPLILRKEVI